MEQEKEIKNEDQSNTSELFLTKDFFEATNEAMKRIEKIRGDNKPSLSQRIASFLAG